ncbi:DUF6973 domain-containing protein [Salegentibacter holothuriorum]|nr:hypothetical protein [Salegentibacter holothuriorum]
MNFKELLAVFKVFISKPRYILPTYRATIETIRICDDLYQKEHHKNGKANAFRHALWNYLICQKCFKISSSVETVRIWSDQFTGLHEKLSPNQKLAKAMDLHNNRFGQTLFKGSQLKTEAIIKLLQERMKEAFKVSKVEEIRKTKNNLVYIED